MRLRRQVLCFAQGSFGVFDHHFLLALPAGFVSDGFAAHRLRQQVGGVIIIDLNLLLDPGLR